MVMYAWEHQLNVGKEWELMILHFGLQSEAYLMVGLLNWSDLWISATWCVFHAMVPPTKKFKHELRFI